MYHNAEKFAQKRTHSYLWENREETFLCSESRVLITVSEKQSEEEAPAEESKIIAEESRLLSAGGAPEGEHTLLVAFAPNPTAGPAAVLP